MRIWYSVDGDCGHARRSDAVIGELLRQGQDVRITASGEAYEALAQRYGDRVTRIKGTRFSAKKEEVLLLRPLSLFILLSKLAALLLANRRATRQLRTEFDPELVITDFEPTASYFSFFTHRRVISLDHEHGFVRCKVEGWRPGLWSSLGVAFWVPKADISLITSFCDAVPRHGERVVPPLLGADVRRVTPQNDGTFVLVYWESDADHGFVDTLAKSDMEYRIYGMGKRGDHANLHFKEFSRERFLDDLRACRWVIVNGGFTVISEALALKKPVFAIPTAQQEEQHNARMLRQAGYGDFAERPTVHDLVAFDEGVEECRKKLSSSAVADPATVARLILSSARAAPPRPR